MGAIAFDTHLFVKRLTEAGMPEPQAEVLAESQAELINEKLVTRDYFELRMKELENTLTIRLGSMMFAGVIVVAAMVKFL